MWAVEFQRKVNLNSVQTKDETDSDFCSDCEIQFNKSTSGISGEVKRYKQKISQLSIYGHLKKIRTQEAECVTPKLRKTSKINRDQRLFMI